MPGSVAGHGQTTDLAYRDRVASTADAPPFVGGLVAPNGAPLKGPSASNADSSAWAKSTEREVMDKGGMGQGSYGGGATNQAAYGGGGGGGAANQAAYGGTGTAHQAASGTGIDETYVDEPTTGTAGTGATQGGTTAQKSGSQGVATTGGAIAAGAAAGGLAADGARGSQANQGVASDYNMQSAQDKGAPTADHLYDQVSPRSSVANKKAQETSHKSNGSKETKTNHKEKNNTAYAGSDAQTRDAAYGGNGNNAQAGNAAQSGYGGNPPAYGNGAESNAAAYGGKETRASNAAYGNEAKSTSNAGYGDKAVNADEAAFGDESYVGGDGSGVSRQGTTKVAERAGHHVLHKDPPASHPAAALTGVE